MEPADNRQLPGRPWAPGSGQACRKILGFALIPNCELKFGPVHNAPGTWLHKGGPAVPPQAPRSRRPGASPPPAQRGRPVGVCGGPPRPHLGLPGPFAEPRAAGEPALLLRPRRPRLGLSGRAQPSSSAGRSLPGRAVRWDLLGKVMASCCPSSLTRKPEEAGLNYPTGGGRRQGFSPPGAGKPVPSPPRGSAISQ